MLAGALILITLPARDAAFASAAMPCYAAAADTRSCLRTILRADAAARDVDATPHAVIAIFSLLAAYRHLSDASMRALSIAANTRTEQRDTPCCCYALRDYVARGDCAMV